MRSKYGSERKNEIIIRGDFLLFQIQFITSQRYLLKLGKQGRDCRKSEEEKSKEAKISF